MLDRLEEGLPLEAREETFRALGMEKEPIESLRRRDRIFELWEGRRSPSIRFPKTFRVSELARLKRLHDSLELDREAKAWSFGVIQHFQDIPESVAHRFRAYLEGRGDSESLIRAGTFHHHDRLWVGSARPVTLTDSTRTRSENAGGYYPLEPCNRFTMGDLLRFFEESFDLRFSEQDRRKHAGYFSKILLRDYHLEAVLHAISKASDLYHDHFDEFRLVEPGELSRRFVDDATEERTTFLAWGEETLRWNRASKKEFAQRFYGIDPQRLPNPQELLEYVELRWITLMARPVSKEQYDRTAETLVASSQGQAYRSVLLASEALMALSPGERAKPGAELYYHARIRSEARRVR